VCPNLAGRRERGPFRNCEKPVKHTQGHVNLRMLKENISLITAREGGSKSEVPGGEKGSAHMGGCELEQKKEGEKRK